MKKNAIPSIEGFDYQGAVAIDRITSLISDEGIPEEHVSVVIEGEDDVKVSVRDSHTFIQTKYSQGKPEKNLLIRDDFWRCINHWVDIERKYQPETLPFYEFVANHDLRWGAELIEENQVLDYDTLVREMKDRLREGKKQKLKYGKLMENVKSNWDKLESEFNAMRSFVERITIRPNYPDIQRLDEDLHQRLSLTWMDSEGLDNIVRGIEGWYKSIKRQGDDEYKAITGADLYGQIKINQQNQQSKRLEIEPIWEHLDQKLDISSQLNEKYYSNAHEALKDLPSAKNILRKIVLRYCLCVNVEEHLESFRPSHSRHINKYHDMIYRDIDNERDLLAPDQQGKPAALIVWFLRQKFDPPRYLNQGDTNLNDYAQGVGHKVLENKDETWY